MELDKKRFSIRRHITLVLTLLTVLIVLLIGVCVAVVREQSRIRLTSAADSYLSLLTRTLENQLVIQESYITSQVLNSEELHRLGFWRGPSPRHTWTAISCTPGFRPLWLRAMMSPPFTCTVSRTPF